MSDPELWLRTNKAAIAAFEKRIERNRRVREALMVILTLAGISIVIITLINA